MGFPGYANYRLASTSLGFMGFVLFVFCFFEIVFLFSVCLGYPQTHVYLCLLSRWD